PPEAAGLEVRPDGPVRPASRVPMPPVAVRRVGDPRVQARHETRALVVPATAARIATARRVARGGAGRVRPAARPPGLARAPRAALLAATTPGPFVTAPPATARAPVVPVLAAHARAAHAVMAHAPAVFA